MDLLLPVLVLSFAVPVISLPAEKESGAEDEDQVSALFVSRLAGKDHARVAINAAKAILNVTGHGTKVPESRWAQTCTPA